MSSNNTDKLLSVATVLVLLVALAPWISTLWPREHVAVRVGDRVTPKLTQQQQWTVVALLDADCIYCTHSMPFYKRIRTNHQGIAFVVAGKDGDSLERYCQSHDLQATRYESITQDELRFPITPFLLFVDPSGVIRHIWPGRLSLAGERSVEAAIAKPGS